MEGIIRRKRENETKDWRKEEENEKKSLSVERRNISFDRSMKHRQGAIKSGERVGHGISPDR